MKRDAVLAALVLIVVALIAVLGRHEQRPAYATRNSGDASFGGYLGWYELLHAEGVAATRFRQLHLALDRAALDTLLVFDAEAPAFGIAGGDDGALAQTRAWVRRGGRLVTENANTPVFPRSATRDAKHPSLPPLHPARAGGPLRGPWAVEVHALAALSAQRFVARRGDEVLLADRGGPIVVRVRDGAGDVVGVVSAAPFENRHLGLADNARLAVLLAMPRRGGTVAFDEAAHGEVPHRPWYAALDVPERVALGIVAPAMLLWLLHGAFRLGPAVALAPPREPTSAEFVDAVAALHHRAGARSHAAGALLTSARRALEGAPRTAENRALAAEVEAASSQPIDSDAALVAFARLTRRTREDVQREDYRSARRTTSA